ncbi:MAG: M15 family metallopeptidase [Lachnospiraceae bacterium]|nr:M15 family metallopeptidase [Lachnospiraceae bacterium]
MVCASLAHYLTGSETLEEYALNNPEQAYGTAADSDSSPPDTTSSISETDTETPNEPFAYDNSEETTADADTSMPPALDEENLDEPDSDAEISEKENDDMADNQERTTYQPGFYYEPLSDDIKQRITGISYPETGCTVPYEDLNYVRLLYIDFNGEAQEGELICNKAIAQDMVEIFYELYRNEYQIERIRLIDEYDGDDTLSMLDNNTSCFNYRVVDGTDNLSKHALGCAIDINPFYNPYVVFNRGENGETYISPKGSEIYADRSQEFPYKIDETDLCYRLFTERGFTWGGNWNSCKDYQHFQIVL